LTVEFDADAVAIVLKKASATPNRAMDNRLATRRAAARSLCVNISALQEFFGTHYDTFAQLILRAVAVNV
jgi:hypothetical protein